MTLDLQAANPDDIAYIMDVERMPGYDRLVGRWEAPQHREAMADPGYRYFIASEAGRRLGFVLVKGWGSPDHVTLIKRVAVEAPGGGIGSRMVSAALAEIFGATDAYRVWIGCFPDNLRARRAYEKAGFIAEGVARGNAYFYGEHHDELILAILRPEWEARHRL
ncbi:GNAT family N-acetyltransferase [Gellertiella hungarica]|uniref:RimJ/RimL family protein N-acetyltransferase n=1 Tax=Gellertiella hungarica TaxID=1572859 RepID=A0A7W6NL33_9HYPH|nr:GNAT family N-acetyltransferase [Gellertiella hungarica]MBB4065483.1 RimJ/RimL family protein N-acetyltransferase [Gellertiella hungarica]